MKKYFAILALAPLLFTAAACSNHRNVPSIEAETTHEGGIFEAPNFLPEIQPKEEETVPGVGKSEQIPEEELPKTISYILVKTSGLNVRTGAGTNYGTLGQVEKGVLLPLRGTTRNWYETEYRGKTAYVSADAKYTALFELERGTDAVERVIAEGGKYLGTPYVYGATRYHDGKGNLLRGFTTDKFDCSSLMQYVFYRGADVLLDVTTRTQIVQGTHVAKGDIRRGDLLFFTNASRKNLSGIERVGHVALYLGDNYILHTASDYAKIEQISTTRWGYFIEARRVL